MTTGIAWYVFRSHAQADELHSDQYPIYSCFTAVTDTATVFVTLRGIISEGMGTHLEACIAWATPVLLFAAAACKGAAAGRVLVPAIDMLLQQGLSSLVVIL